MRKHFLILFLLTLLPFAGWAQVDISGVYPTIGADTYEYSANTPTITMTVLSPSTNLAIAAENYDLVYYDENGNSIAKTAVKNVGTYFVAAKAKDNTEYTGTTQMKQFTITKKAVTVSYDVDATGDKVLTAIYYGEATPTLDASKLFYAGFAGSDTKTVVNTTGFTAVIDKTTASADKDGNALTGINASSYTLSGLTADNYTFTYSKVTLRIKQIELAATPATIPADGKNYFTYATSKKGANAFTYNADAQYPTYTITYHDRQGNTHNLAIATTTAENDYSVAYDKKGLGGTDAYTGTYNATVKDAAWYKGQITGAGNYSGTLALTEADFEYQIAKKGITVYAKPMTGKIYDGAVIPTTGVDTDNDNTDDDVDVTGAEVVCPVLTADVALKANIKVHFETAANNTTVPKDAGEYTLIPYAVGEGLGNNYNPTFLEVGSYPISRRQVTVTAKNQTFTYTGSTQSLNTTIATTGDNITVAYSGVTGITQSGVVEGEAATVGTLFTIVLKSGVTIKETNNDAYTGAITIVPTAAEATSNYEIVPVAGNVIVNGKALYVIAPTFDEEYGYEVDEDDLTPLLNVTTVALTGTPQYTITDTEDNTKTYSIGDKLPIGTYTLSVVQSSVTAPANYTIERFEDGLITVTKKTLTAVVASQTVSLNAVVTGDGNVLQQGSQYVTFTGLVGNEKVKYTISSASSTATENAEGIANAITVAFAEPTAAENTAGTYSNSNYTLADADITKGKLYVVGENTVILSRDEADLVNFIKTNKSADATVANQKTIKFSARALGDEAWNSFVLPFDVTVAKLSQAVGYCLVNVLDKTNSKVVDNKAQARFKIEMNTIPANTPFLMKTADAINMSDVTIAGVTLVEAATTPVVNNDGDIKFIPQYARTQMKATDRFPANATDDVKWKVGNNEEATSTDAVFLKPLASYIQVPEGVNARIFVEDFENGTTAIKEIGVDGTNKAYSVDGWYTLNGVKLQSAPTTKGIYINNGKKVVIK